MALRKKTGATEAREKLFDRVFKPQEMLLPNGHSVMRPRSRLPLIWGVILIAIAWALWFTGFDVSILIERGYQFGVVLKRVFTPDMSYLDKVWSPLFDTIKMSVIGSVLGSTLALPFAVLASTNIINIVRTLPTLVIASIFALIFGLGTFAGTVAITVFTFGIVAKMLYESIETIDMGPFEAMESLGANKFRAFWSACFPQILPTYLSQCLYSFEINVRAAAILGYVGAGGLGILINERIGWRDYESLGTVLLTLFVVVLIIENLSQYLRSKLS